MLNEPLLTAFTLTLAGLEFATWFFAYETRKTFKGGIFWNAWRLIASSLPMFMVDQLVLTYEAVYGSTFLVNAIGESFQAAGTLLLLVGFYQFYRAWNPSAMKRGGDAA
ncbi:MAG TPA: hypothetical protein VLX56_01725 [Nitrososphaerales archaeon]|nr:hypothetical protein [Nitrososphaerales archaeon]